MRHQLHKEFQVITKIIMTKLEVDHLRIAPTLTREGNRTYPFQTTASKIKISNLSKQTTVIDIMVTIMEPHSKTINKLLRSTTHPQLVLTLTVKTINMNSSRCCTKTYTLIISINKLDTILHNNRAVNKRIIVDQILQS